MRPTKLSRNMIQPMMFVRKEGKRGWGGRIVLPLGPQIHVRPMAEMEGKEMKEYNLCSKITIIASSYVTFFASASYCAFFFFPVWSFIASYCYVLKYYNTLIFMVSCPHCLFFFSFTSILLSCLSTWHMIYKVLISIFFFYLGKWNCKNAFSFKIYK